MESMDRLITTLLDGKFATLDAKKELAKSLGIKVGNIIGFELLSDELGMHQAIAVTLDGCILEKNCLMETQFEYITVNSEGDLILVIYDEPK